MKNAGKLFKKLLTTPFIILLFKLIMILIIIIMMKTHREFQMMEFDRDQFQKKFIISATTSGFNNVEVSPRLEISLLATFLKILRIILPDLVLGNPFTI